MSNLPFLKKKTQQPGIAVEYRSPDDDESEPNKDEPLEACAEDLIRCVASSDKAGVAKALRAAFDILDSEPHEEGPHTNDEEE